ncbi:MAG: ATP-dependent DNA helicase [Pseudomonadota bacterium]|nr:ATP-dependent DNA helicase [Pseudomonadota bacterium]
MTKHDPLLMHQGVRAVCRNAIGKLLRGVFGVERLRDGQQQVIDSVLDGKDTLAIMPTGSGKSLCYQIPARMLGGTTIVVSPLISLMKDQLEKLTELGIRAAQINSSLTADEQQAALDGIGDRSHEIVFCTPERLAQAEFLAVLKQIDIALVVIDEAHCISQWGHDFRPAYLEMAAAIDALGRPPLLALTATATDDVVADIARQLGRARLNVINTGIYRPNLHYSVVQVVNQREKIGAALRIVRHSDGFGIVYAATVKAAEDMLAALRDAGESATIYHGKLPARERKQNQDLFMDGQRRVMVATNAFGMGIDKSDTRFVIHLQVPANLEAYYQESGRAGRDGNDAWCTLLFLQDDKRVQQFFLVKHYPDAAQLRAVYHTVLALIEAGPASFARIHDAGGEIAAARLKICLKLLKDGALLRQDRALAFVPGKTAPGDALFEQLAQVYAQKQERDRAALEQMVAYALSGACRWKVLLDYFGDAVPGFEQCCRCDNCRNPPAVLADIAIRDDEFERAPAAAPAPPPFAVGAQVKVPKFDVGVVEAVAGDQVTIAFPEHGSRTFMADFVAPA